MDRELTRTELIEELVKVDIDREDALQYVRELKRKGLIEAHSGLFPCSCVKTLVDYHDTRISRFRPQRTVSVGSYPALDVEAEALAEKIGPMTSIERHNTWRTSRAFETPEQAYLGLTDKFPFLTFLQVYFSYDERELAVEQFDKLEESHVEPQRLANKTDLHKFLEDLIGFWLSEGNYFRESFHGQGKKTVGRFASLMAFIVDLSAQIGWSDADTFYFFLTGEIPRVPSATVYIRNGLKLSKNRYYQYATITVNKAVTKQDFNDLYDTIRKEFELKKKKPLTEKQTEVYRFVEARKSRFDEVGKMQALDEICDEWNELHENREDWRYSKPNFGQAYRRFSQKLLKL